MQRLLRKGSIRLTRHKSAYKLLYYGEAVKIYTE